MKSVCVALTENLSLVPTLILVTSCNLNLRGPYALFQTLQVATLCGICTQRDKQINIKSVYL